MAETKGYYKGITLSVPAAAFISVDELNSSIALHDHL
jgi:hypothetical protein